MPMGDPSAGNPRELEEWQPKIQYGISSLTIQQQIAEQLSRL
jgi:hypothetical protein